MAEVKKYKLDVTVKWSSLYKDITDKAYRMARLTRLGIDLATSNESSDGQKMEGEISLSAGDENMIRRAMREAIAEIVTMCDEYIWHKGQASDDLTIADGSDVNFVLMMPLNYNLAGTLALGTMMHKYIVAYALKDWFTYTAISDKQSLGLKEQKDNMADARYSIANILSKRVRPVRNGTTVSVSVG